MAGFIFRRLAWALFLAILISFFTFIIFFIIPGDSRASRGGAVTVSLLQQYKLEHTSVFQAYGEFVWRFVRHGELGESFYNNQSVNERLSAALPVTVALVVGGALL